MKPEEVEKLLAEMPAAKPLTLEQKWGCGIAAFIAALILGAFAFASWKNKAAQSVVAQATSEASKEIAPPQSSADAYGERLKNYWLPEAKALPAKVPPDDTEVGKLLTSIDELAIAALDGVRLDLSADQQRDRLELLTTLADKQRRLLPAMRKSYAEALSAQLFRRDVSVDALGSAAKALRFTGPIFVRNANIDDMQTAMLPNLRRFRYQTVEYRWNASMGKVVTYDVEPPADHIIGTWEGGRFDKVPVEPVYVRAVGKKQRDPDCVPELAAQIGLRC